MVGVGVTISVGFDDISVEVTVGDDVSVNAGVEDETTGVSVEENVTEAVADCKRIPGILKIAKKATKAARSIKIPTRHGHQSFGREAS